MTLAEAKAIMDNPFTNTNSRQYVEAVRRIKTEQAANQKDLA